MTADYRTYSHKHLVVAVEESIRMKWQAMHRYRKSADPLSRGYARQLRRELINLLWIRQQALGRW